MKNSVIINKGNYSLETPQREAAAKFRRSYGWEEAYAAYRTAWVQRPQEGNYGDWPLLVDLELSSACNLKCPMCYTISDAFKNKVARKFMSMDLFHKIVDEIAAHVPALRLSFRGEPTLHPDFIECIAYAKSKGVREISFLTNGSKFDSNFIFNILKSGVDWITFSVDGMHSRYEAIRNPLKFNNIVSSISMLKAERDRQGLQRPVIKVQTIWPAIEDCYEEYYDLFSHIADEMAFNPLVKYDECLIDDSYYIDDFVCPMLFQRLVVTSSGQVLACANDENGDNIIEDINNSTIYDVWNGSSLQNFRQKHRDCAGFKNFTHCKKCYLPRKTVDRSHSFLNGRQFVVRDYLPLD